MKGAVGKTSSSGNSLGLLRVERDHNVVKGAVAKTNPPPFPPFQSQTSMILATLHDRTTHRLLTVDLMRMVFVVEDSDGCTLHMRDGGYVIAVVESRERVMSLFRQGSHWHDR